MARQNLSTKGQVLILFACALVVMCAVAVFTVDIGYLCMSNARLQNAADAASKAAVLELYERRQAGDDEAAARNAALAEGMAIAGLNSPGAGENVVFGRWEGWQFVVVDTTIPANAASIKAFRNETASGGPARTFFAGAFGLENVNLARSAVARTTRPGFVPFGLWEGDLVPPGDTMVIYDDTKVAPGAFGLLDFDGGANSAEDIKNWTRYGYEGPLALSSAPNHLVLEGTTGFKASMDDGLQYHVGEGDVVMACIYRTVWGNGANASFEMVGLVAITLKDARLKGGNKYVKAEVVDTYFVDSGESRDDFMQDLTRLQLVQ